MQVSRLKHVHTENLMGQHSQFGTPAVDQSIELEGSRSRTDQSLQRYGVGDQQLPQLLLGLTRPHKVAEFDGVNLNGGPKLCFDVRIRIAQECVNSSACTNKVPSVVERSYSSEFERVTLVLIPGPESFVIIRVFQRSQKFGSGGHSNVSVGEYRIGAAEIS